MVGDDSRSCSSSLVPGAITALLREAFQAPQPPDGGISEFRPGVVIGRFELVRKLGRGGFGVVFEALDRTLGRAVAFKAVRPIGDLDAKAEMLLREAEAAAQLSHPNIVVLHDVGRCEHGPYLVMELLRGETLAERLAAGAVPAPEALHVALEIAKGVAHAHARGVVHRDLKPANVFLCEDGQVKVLDFGMARIFGRAKPDGGTLAYMAPEQRRGELEDERTDVFALGVILHEMLAGARPFADEGALATGDRAPALELAVPQLAELVARMVALDPAGRPRNGSEVLAALRAADRESRGLAPEARPGRRRPLRWATVGATAATAAVALAVVLARGGPPAASPPSSGTSLSTPPPVAAPLAAVAPAATSAGTAAARPDGPRPEPGAPATPPRPSGGARLAHPESVPPAAGARRPRAVPREAVRYCLGSIDSVPTPRPESGDGVLVVVADPFGEVLVDGRAYGETPSECVLAAGAHLVRASHPTYGTREARVEVRAGERARFTADFLDGR